MNFTRIKYENLNAKQQEIFNFQRVAALLAGYGFNCIKLADDWQSADFLAYHIDGKVTYRVQLKSRLTIDRNYVGRDLCLAFPHGKSWYMVEHDHLVKLVGEKTKWLNSNSWLDKGHYHTAKPNKILVEALHSYVLSDA